MLILGYMEQRTLADEYVNWGGNDSTVVTVGGTTYTGTRYGAAPNTTNVTTKRLASFTCPSDQPNAPISGMTSHNYAVNWGNTSYARTADLNGVLYRGGPFSIAASAAQPFKGKTLADILDGTSNTMMVAEVLQGRNADLRGFTWWGDACQFTAYLPPNSALPDRIYSAGYCVNRPELNLPCAVSDAANPTMFASRSRHPGGVQVVMCDGATRFVAESIDLDIWRAASTIEGAEAYGLP